MFAAVETRGVGRPTDAPETGRAASLRRVSDELFLSGSTSTRLSPKTIHDIERNALRKLRQSIGSMLS